MKCTGKNNLILFFLLLFLVAFSGMSVAESFPFRNVSIGDPLPAADLVDYKGREQSSFAKFQGRNFVVVLWGADNNGKKRRTIKAFEHLKKIMAFLENNKVPVFTVNILDDDAGVIEEVMQQSKLSLPVYYDRGKNLYGDLGVFVMPCVMLVDTKGHIVAAMGISHDIMERLTGEVEILLGSKTRAQVEQELHPQTVEKPKEEKEARRYMNLGNTMISRGMPESAIGQFEKALTFNPNLAEAHVALGCLYLDAEKLDKAETSLSKGLDLAPDSVRGQICRARLRAQKGKVDEALQDLQGLMLRNSRDPELRYALGLLYEKKSDYQKAAGEYRKAYELLFKRQTLESAK